MLITLSSYYVVNTLLLNYTSSKFILENDEITKPDSGVIVQMFYNSFKTQIVKFPSECKFSWLLNVRIFKFACPLNPFKKDQINMISLFSD